MATAHIIPIRPTLLQRGLKVNLNIKPKAYVRVAGQPKPSNRIEMAAYCHA